MACPDSGRRCQLVMPGFAEVFESLPTPQPERPGATVFSARPVGTADTHRIAKQSTGAPALLISVSSSTGGVSRPAPIELENLQVQHDLDCAISQPDGARETGRFSVIRCKGDSRELHTYFLRVSEAIVQAIGPAPTIAQVAAAVDRLLELFSAMSLPAKKSVQGLWAEVYLVASGADPALLIQAWHAEPGDRYDFNDRARRIEVKSCTGSPRRHHFTLEQLTPPRGARVLIASLYAQRAGGGVSIADLVERIRSAVNDPELVLRLESIIAATLGDSWPNGLRDHFDEEVADDSLLFFRAEAVPSIADNLPPELSQVRFIADLSAAMSTGKEEFESEGGIFAAVV